MPAILAFFKVFLSAAVLGPLLKRILVALGVGAVSYVGVLVVTTQLTDAIAANYSGLPSDAIQILRIAKIPNALNIIISAFVTSLTVRGLTSAGSISRVMWRPGQTGTLF
jgi:hypothetical protein